VVRQAACGVQEITLIICRSLERLAKWEYPLWSVYKVSVVDGVLQEDVLFSSPSYAAMFVIGKSANGLTSWKDSDGHSLKEIENKETTNVNK
jgi:hypothetical protein